MKHLALARSEPSPARPTVQPVPSGRVRGASVERQAAPQADCSAVVARQFSLWPFGTRTLRLFLLIDPSQVDVDLQRGILRAMQEAFAHAETGSQTSAVRAAARAAHYVLQHHNRDVLPSAHVTASAAVVSTRGRTAYAALIGNAAVFAVREGALSGQSSSARLSRLLGLEHDPRVTLWSTPLEPGDRLVLVCGAATHTPLAEIVAETLAGCPPEAAEARLGEVLARPSRPARVLVVDPARPTRAERHLAVVPPQPPAASPAGHAWPGVLHPRRWLASLLPLAVLGLAALPLLGPAGQSAPPNAAQEVQELLAEVDSAADVHAAHRLAASAVEAASRASTLAPDAHAPLIEQTTRKLDQVDHVSAVTPALAVRLGPSGAHVVDLCVADDALYTLDPVETSVRAFAADGVDQTPTPATLLLRPGSVVGARHLATPVAIEYVAGPGGAPGALVVVDDARTLVQVAHDGSMTTQVLPSSAGWQQLGALASDAQGTLYVLDTAAKSLLAYPGASQHLADPPRRLFESTPGFDPGLLEHAAEVLPLEDLYLRLDDGSVRRVDPAGSLLPFDVQPTDGPLGAVAGLADDRAGGLYLADPAHARIVQTTADGTFVRQLRDPALAGLRQIHASPDGRRLYGLMPSGVLVLDVPPAE